MGFKSGTAFLWGVKEPRNTGGEIPSKASTAALSSVYENWLSLNNTGKDYDVCAAEDWVAQAVHSHLPIKIFIELVKQHRCSNACDHSRMAASLHQTSEEIMSALLSLARTTCFLILVVQILYSSMDSWLSYNSLILGGQPMLSAKGCKEFK